MMKIIKNKSPFYPDQGLRRLRIINAALQKIQARLHLGRRHALIPSFSQHVGVIPLRIMSPAVNPVATSQKIKSKSLKEKI